MDGFVLVSGVGSLVVAGFCYAAFRNTQNVASFLKNTESLDVGKDLFEKIKEAPFHTLDYIAIRGEAKAIESTGTLRSNNVPSAKLLIQRTTLLEHKLQWSKSSSLWRDTKRTISTVVNDVPFSLNSSNARFKVMVDEPFSASGLEYNRIYDKYDPLNTRSVSAGIVQWVSGEKTKGIQTIEDALLEGTTLTAVGKVTLQNGSLRINQPEIHEYFLSKWPLEGIIKEKTKSCRRWKYVTIGFAMAGGALLLYWLYRKWRRGEGRVNARFIHPALVEEPEGGEEQLCVICLTEPRNIVILDCGHICACRACATQVNTCPICRAEIVRLVPTYQS